jgi:hypothetical protein
VAEPRGDGADGVLRRQGRLDRRRDVAGESAGQPSSSSQAAQKAASAASWLVYVLVAATACSAPAPVASARWAERASRLSASLVIASV